MVQRLVGKRLRVVQCARRLPCGRHVLLRAMLRLVNLLVWSGVLLALLLRVALLLML